MIATSIAMVTTAAIITRASRFLFKSASSVWRGQSMLACRSLVIFAVLRTNMVIRSLFVCLLLSESFLLPAI